MELGAAALQGISGKVKCALPHFHVSDLASKWREPVARTCHLNEHCRLNPLQVWTVKSDDDDDEKNVVQPYTNG